jgi:SAM-dependent methyltransferase
MADANRGDLGRVFNEVPELYDRVRPAYPDELFADLVAITGMDERSRVLEVGCGTGQATRSLAALGCPVTAVEPGAGMAALARQRLAAIRDAEVEISTFEEWNDRGRRFDVLVAASAWHWVDPAVGWRATDEGWGLVSDPGGLFGPTVVRWYPVVQWFDGDGFADLLRSTSLYRSLDSDVREPLLDAIAERISTRMGDRAARRYLSVLRAGQRAG